MKKNRFDILALIPARGGSKRVKNKNIRLLEGKPLIAYTIEAAKQSKCINRIIVSTDSKRIAKVAREYGAEAPFLRPSEIATPESTEFEFHLHALKWLKENEGYEPNLIVNLYPTSPFRKVSTIDKAIEKMLSHPEADSLRTVKRCSEHPYKMWTSSEKYLSPFVSSKNSNIHTLSYHLLPEVYIQNASIYITRPRVIYKYKSTIGKKVMGFIMPEDESFDINTPRDFLIAELMVKQRCK